MPATKTQRATRVSVEISASPYYLKVLNGNARFASVDKNDVTSTEDSGFQNYTGGAYGGSGRLRCLMSHGDAMLSTKLLYENQFVTNMKVWMEGAPSGTVVWVMSSALLSVVDFEINPKGAHILEFEWDSCGSYTRPTGDSAS